MIVLDRSKYGLTSWVNEVYSGVIIWKTENDLTQPQGVQLHAFNIS